MTLLVGLTGGIGSGKSTVANQFAALGVPVIDTDAISHHLTQSNGAAIPALRAALGEEYITPDNALDRHKTRQRIFTDTTTRKQLEAILHPLILAETLTRLNHIQAPYCLVVVPLLYESGQYASWLDRVIVVDCSESNQINRVHQRNGLDEASIRAIMAQQIPRMERLHRANYIIHNEGSLDDLQAQVKAMHQQFLENLSSPARSN